MTVASEGKSFMLDGSPFRFRGVHYRAGSQRSEPRTSDPLRLRLRLRQHLAEVVRAGYTVVSMRPPDSAVCEEVAASGLRVMLELDDLSLPAGASRRERAAFARNLAARARQTVCTWDRAEALLGVVVGPPPGIRAEPVNAELWGRAGEELAMALCDEHASLLIACRGPGPLDGGCPPEWDFLVVDLELSRPDQLVTTLMACHSAVGDRPLVLGNVSVSASEAEDGLDMASLLETAVRCGVAGTIVQPSQDHATPHTARANRKTIRDLDVEWPSISVVVNAYNAQQTLDECLRHCDRLEYPELEVIVVDDGSTDATPTIAHTHSRARVITTLHCGLSASRNIGYRAARGDLVAYLDADAYPSPEWPWYLALAALSDRAGGAGGPNVPPPAEPAPARAVARSPGGPVPQLLTPDRAVHLPGCNMAFWREVLEQLGGFDPVLEGAEDFELQWRLAESGYHLAYHPAALVWHHRRPGLGAYLRQQAHYGRSQATVERRYPERFPRFYRVREALRYLSRHCGEANARSVFPVSYLTLPRHEPAGVVLAHQWGMPLAAAVSCTAPLGLVRRRLAVPAGAGTVFIAGLFAIDLLLAGQGRRHSERTLASRSRVATFSLLRPLAFRWGHLNGRREARAVAHSWSPPPRCGAIAGAVRPPKTPPAGSAQQGSS